MDRIMKVDIQMNHFNLLEMNFQYNIMAPQMKIFRGIFWQNSVASIIVY